ncbi:MAG: hypothetical protein A2Y62_12240 [Candidatus Fischerbacteria bacterium RBG_13_37_8]|uniref:Protein-glutamate methylesterase/protein-glutamine glutaminase n=1 Tax=Candidatus Fischerbacteria bacterium RBG_13_37_8 TaxID=1817863 RepID=A0A1F5VDG2_9BACT|nr:MAG: hypothetical protein A2Y62_12240 [Candidatus Fischerbacteria bacterium RBG_13_37_8]
MIKVLVVDDSAFNRKVISEILQSIDEIEIIGTAHDGEDAIKHIYKQKPDIITLDLEMPKMDGFTFLRWLMNYSPIPVIVVSAKEADENVFKALELGAVDFIPKPSSYPSLKLKEIHHLLIEKILAAKYAKITVPQKKEPKPVPEKHKATRAGLPSDYIVAIGASTGGPQAIQYILSNLAPDFIIPIVVAQHMPPTFTPLFAERLNKKTHFTVKEAETNEIIKPHFAYICPGGKHTIIEKKGSHNTFSFIERTNNDKYIPSINKLFSSLSTIYQDKMLAAILTGMGDDGTEGISTVKASGGKIIAESPDSAIVFGMPGEAIRSGQVDHIFHLAKIPSFISLYTTDTAKKKSPDKK